MKRATKKLSKQMEERLHKEPPPEVPQGRLISTGSTLLDLAISGGWVRGGGLPGGKLVEIFGPASAGKTVLLCEIAGAVQRQGGQVMFKDPEARLNKQFAQIFDLDTATMDYGIPNTVPELFQPVREWKPQPDEGVVHGVFADSLAALSTNLEMEDSDKMGMRRAKEFSEECRKTCRVLTERGFLMVCSNQVRQNVGATSFQKQTTTPGGKAIEFYSSLRLELSKPRKIYRELKKEKRVIGVTARITVEKSTIWKPYRFAEVHILFDYGIDDIRANLEFLKRGRDYTSYKVWDEFSCMGITKAIQEVEELELEETLREQVIDLWEEIEARFVQDRKGKRRE